MWYLGLVLFHVWIFLHHLTDVLCRLPDIKELGLSQAQQATLALVGGLSVSAESIWGAFPTARPLGTVHALAYLALAAAYTVFALVRSPTGFYLSAFIFGLTAWSIPRSWQPQRRLRGRPVAPAGLFCHPLLRHRTGLGPYVGGNSPMSLSRFMLPFLLASGVSLLERSRLFICEKPR